MINFKGVIMQNWQLEFLDAECMFEEIQRLRKQSVKHTKALKHYASMGDGMCAAVLFDDGYTSDCEPLNEIAKRALKVS